MKRPLNACAALIAAIIACGGEVPVATSAPTAEVPPGMSATVVRVFDGDSFEAKLDGELVEVRLLGINAPEGSECHGDAARDRLEELLAASDLTLTPEGDETEDRFGRLLRSAYAHGQFINATLVAEGHALVLQGGQPQERLLVEQADSAYERRLGMWSPTACGEEGAPAIRILDVEYDPAGRDAENKADEWVAIFNDADSDIDLSGWILRDESSTHRYRFAQGEVLAPGDELRIRTGCGTDRGSDRYWCAADAVWSNGGDTVVLQTPAGTVADRLRYPGDY